MRQRKADRYLKARIEQLKEEIPKNEGDDMTVQWWNKNGVMDYEGYQTRPRAMP